MPAIDLRPVRDAGSGKFIEEILFQPRLSASKAPKELYVALNFSFLGALVTPSGVDSHVKLH